MKLKAKAQNMSPNQNLPIKVSFKSAIYLMSILLIVNSLCIAIHSIVAQDFVFFLGNVLAIGLALPYILLYIQNKETFSLSRYLHFSICTTIAIGIVTYLFVVRF